MMAETITPYLVVKFNDFIVNIYNYGGNLTAVKERDGSNHHYTLDGLPIQFGKSDDLGYEQLASYVAGILAYHKEKKF